MVYKFSLLISEYARINIMGIILSNSYSFNISL